MMQPLIWIILRGPSCVNMCCGCAEPRKLLNRKLQRCLCEGVVVQFVCGVIDKQGNRRILSVESTPTLENIDDLAAHTPIGCYDWGAEADRESRLWAARIILASVADMDSVKAYAELYADSVVSGMVTDRMWVLTEKEIEEWLMKHQKVN
jgi:hypothetical protein